MADRSFEGPTGMNVIDGIITNEPVASIDAIEHLILPALALAFPIAIAVGRALSSALYNVLQQPFIATARGKGLHELSVVLFHGIRNASPPALAMLGLQIRLLFGNLLVVELVFSWPGLGLYMVQSLASADLPAVLGTTTVLGAFYLAVGAAVQLLQTLADPRIEL